METRYHPQGIPGASEEIVPVSYGHRIPLVSKRFRFADEPVFCGRAELYGDRVELRGWRLLGRFTMRIPLDRVVEVDYRPMSKEGNLSLWLGDGEEVKLVMEDAHEWRQSFENWLTYTVHAGPRMIGERDKASAIAG